MLFFLYGYKISVRILLLAEHGGRKLSRLYSLDVCPKASSKHYARELFIDYRGGGNTNMEHLLNSETPSIRLHPQEIDTGK